MHRLTNIRSYQLEINICDTNNRESGYHILSTLNLKVTY